MDLKIDLLTSNLIPPTKSKPRNIWINMWGVERITQKQLKFMADLFCNNPQAAKLLHNMSDKIKEELEVFKRIHNAQFLEK